MKNTAMELLAAGAVVVIFFTVLVALGSTTHTRWTATPTPNTSANPSIVAASPNAISMSPADLKTFKSWEDAKAFLQAANTGRSYQNYAGGMVRETAMPLGAAAPMADKSAGNAVSSGNAGPTYSTTNVQVAGVDEADTLKNDGHYVYTVSNGQITIIDAYPAAQAHIVAVINDSNSSYQSIFVLGDKLVAFGATDYDWQPIMEPLVAADNPASANAASGQTGPNTPSQTQQVPLGARAAISSRPSIGMPICLGCRPYYYGQHADFMKIFDITDRSKPTLVKEIDSKGNLLAARLIGNRVYAIFSEQAGYQWPRPVYTVNGKMADIAPSDVQYIDYPFDNLQFTTVLGQDVDNVNNPEARTVVLTGGASTVYVSAQNAYVTYTQYQTYYPQWKAYQDTLQSHFSADASAKLAAIDAAAVSDWQKDRMKVQVAEDFLQSANQTDSEQWYTQINQRQEALRQKQAIPRESTIVHKFALGSAITYLGKGQTPGHLLNQFSMDESNGYLRLATTVSQQWVANPVVRIRDDVMPGSGGYVQPTPIPSKNNVYVLDGSLNTVGKLEDLAPGESIYSARFIGNRTYLVTFRQLDPLFVIGLDDPTNPTLLGKLKIPGFSNYLHPFDATHLIGFGKDAIPTQEQGYAFPLGLKLALFDVSDVAHPTEVANYSIGDAGTDSYALNDHKAFLFNPDNGLLVIPVRLALLDPSQKSAAPQVHVYGNVVFQGAYVFNVKPDSGFTLKGTVSHADNETLAKMGDYYYGDGTDVTRSAYIENSLYTVSDKYVKANDLDTLAPQASMTLPQPPEPQYPHPYYANGGIMPMAAGAPAK